MSTAVATAERERTGLTPRHAAWAGIALGVLAWFVALPPILARTPVPSIVLGVAGGGAGGSAICRRPRRGGWGAGATGVIGAIGGVAATHSGTGHLADVVTWS